MKPGSTQRWHDSTGGAWALNTRIHAIGDGATWLSEQARERFGACHRYTLDLFHVSEYLSDAWPQERAVVSEHCEALKRGEVEKVLRALEQRREPESKDEEHAPFRRALRYMDKRRHQLDYASALKEGLPVGSGLIESAHRHLLQARLKIAGA